MDMMQRFGYWKPEEIVSRGGRTKEKGPATVDLASDLGGSLEWFEGRDELECSVFPEKEEEGEKGREKSLSLRFARRLSEIGAWLV
ncbi:Os01g0444100 [Oryza sativa Japonica Group]|uniref:Os01g0444100 protein n=1 Tax=Oryza sativa subsp. japonica TaxID=39947 RepID=C7IXF3_ORYSJ|nr:Os01g0444100 [Oryza sativa Japonica Group]|eukprot:NP_001172367.1 Os01g0444100 [Oryza sativa Japonica Group]